MKRVVTVIATVLFASASVFADSTCPSDLKRHRLAAEPVVQVSGEAALVESARRVRGVFRVFGEDDAAASSPKSGQSRRRVRRNSRCRKAGEPQKSRCTRQSKQQLEGILILLDGSLSAL